MARDRLRAAAALLASLPADLSAKSELAMLFEEVSEQLELLSK